jgi:hypothetical protein
VLVVSRGDEELVHIGPRQALHFPQDDEGRYAGYHPSDSDAAIAMLEELRQRTGADYLLLPATAFWWLEYYDGFKSHIERHYQVVEAGEHCWIVQLAERADAGGRPAFTGAAPPTPDVLSPMQLVIQALLPPHAELAVLQPAGTGASGPDGVQTWLMPQYPDAKSLSKSLSALEQSGIQFVVIPKSAFDWLDDNPQVTEWLRDRHRFVTRQEHLCEIYELHPQAAYNQLHGSEEGNATKRSFGEKLRGILFSSRRNGQQP